MRDYALGTTFDVKFTTRQTTGAPFTLAGTPVISAYPDNSLTQLTAGITLTVDFDGVTGLHNVRVVATSGNGYAAGSNYALVITTGTVNSVSVVGEVVAEFSLEAQSPLRPTTAGRTLDVSAGGEAGVDWANVGSPTTTVGLSGTTVKTATDVETDTADIQTRLPAALTSNGNMKSSLMEILTTALTETAGLLAGGFKKFFNVASPTGTLNSIPDAVAGAAGGLFIAGTNAATTVTTALTTTFTGNLTGPVGSLAAQAKADVNAEVVDALNVDTYAEPGQGAPAATTTLVAKLGYVYKFLRNKIEQTATETKVYNDDGTTVGQKATVSDDATTYTRGEFGTGA